MSYLEKSLATNEIVVGRAYFHWSYRLVALLSLLFLGIFLIGIWIFFAMMIPVWTTEIAVTNQRFLVKRGWLRLSTQEIVLSNIEGVRVTQGFWGRVFGYGHVHVEGTGVDTVDTPPIAHPVQFRRDIENAKFGGVRDSQNAMRPAAQT